MSIESLTALINDMQNHAQGISHEVDRVASLYLAAIEYQNSDSFIRQLYLDEHKNLEALIATEERIYRHAEFLRGLASLSSKTGGTPNDKPRSSRETNRGD